MAISREKKQQIVDELVRLLEDSKLTVFANYEGLSVAGAQQLRKQAAQSDTVVKVVKNRLAKVAMGRIERLKDLDTAGLKGQLLYAASPKDQVTAAKTLAEFGKQHSSVRMVGGIDAEGNLLAADAVKQLAELPGVDELRAQLASTLAAPLQGLTGALNANLEGLLNVLRAKAQATK